MRRACNFYFANLINEQKQSLMAIQLNSKASICKFILAEGAKGLGIFERNEYARLRKRIKQAVASRSTSRKEVLFSAKRLADRICAVY